MKKIATGLFAALLAGVVAVPVFAATDPKSSPAIETPEEVIIRAKRMKLYQMRMEMVEVEDRFYAKYNEINTDDQYDVVCTLVPRTGEIRDTRRCEPAFVERYNSEYAGEVQELFNSNRSGVLTRIPTNRDQELFSKWMALKDHARSVINKSPELKKMVRHREALEKSYQAEQKVRLNGRLVLIE